MTKQEKFQQAVEENNIETIKELLKDSEVDPADDDSQAIGHAILKGYVEVAKLLLNDRRAKPNNNHIQQASEKGYAELVDLLLNVYKINPTGRNNYAITYAALNGHTEVVRLLLDDDRVDPAADNNGAIKQASLKGHVEVVNMLYYDYRICHQQLVLDIIKEYKYFKPIDLIKKLISDKDLHIFHPENETLDGKITSLDLIKKLYNADEETKQAFIECGFNQNLFTFISLL